MHAFDTDWYLPETLGDDLRVLRDVLAPRVIAGTYLHPREVAADVLAGRRGRRSPWR